MNLSKREKTLLKILCGFLACVAAYYFIILPVIKLATDKSNGTETGRDEMDKLNKIYQEYREVQQKRSAFTAILNKKNENITSLVEQWANTAGIAKNIGNSRSSESNIQNKYIRITADVKFDSVAIQDFFRFLYEAENSDNLLKVNYLRIYPALKGTNTYDINVKIDKYVSQ